MLAHETNCRRGFTLVELLVVVAVIALLISVLLPALSGARESSRRVMSAANLRQLAILKNTYAEDYQDWFPMLLGSNITGTTERKPSVTKLAENQWSWGGYAGFYSLNQKNGDTSTGIYRKNAYPRWVSGAGAGKGVWKLETDKSHPVMERYMEGPQSYAILQNPADSADGGENGPKYPVKAPEKIVDEFNVTWYNISYLYIAGLKRTDPSLCFLGDETNAVDIGADPSSSGPSGIVNYQGTFRVRYQDIKARGLQSVDNHGEAGGNYAYSDGHVEWIAGSKNSSVTTGSGVMPHDRIFNEINMFLSKRGNSTTQVQTVD